MKVVRNFAKLKKMGKEDDCFVNASPVERVGFIWELTAELWALRNRHYVKQRLQRHVAALTKQEG